MPENTTLIRQVALLSIIAMAVVALSAGVATADHNTPEGEVTIKAPDSVETGDDFKVTVNLPTDFHHGHGGVSLEIHLETSEKSDYRHVDEFVEAGTSKTVTVTTDHLGQASGEATIEANYYMPLGKKTIEKETVNLEAPRDLPWWITLLPDWLMDYYLYLFGY